MDLLITAITAIKLSRFMSKHSHWPSYSLKNRKEEFSMLSLKIQLDCIELALTTSLSTSLAIMRNNHDNNYLNKLCENVVVLTDALYTM